MQLPYSRKGFTLIELLVVIAIIGILAVIAISTFAGAQGSARDGVRRSNISSIAKSIESSKDFTSNVYLYATATGNADFPRGIPDDPQSSSAQHYCISATTASNSLASTNVMTASWTTAACPAGSETLTSSFNAGSQAASLPYHLGPGGIKSWTLCASLERSSTPFCIQSLSQ